MFISDLQGNLGPKFYETALSVGAHACTAAAAPSWSHVTTHLHASAGMYNLKWSWRSSDYIGSSGSEPAVLLISPAPLHSPPPFLLSLPLLLLQLSHAFNFTDCDPHPFTILTTCRARACVDEGADLVWEEEGSGCSSSGDVQLRCSASPTAGPVYSIPFLSSPLEPPPPPPQLMHLLSQATRMPLLPPPLFLDLEACGASSGACCGLANSSLMP